MIYVAPYILASHGRLHGGDDPAALILILIVLVIITAAILWDCRK